MIHNGLQKGAKFFFLGALPLDPHGGLSISAMAWAYQPKPPLHGLSFRKSLIKTITILFQVRS